MLQVIRPAEGGMAGHAGQLLRGLSAGAFDQALAATTELLHDAGSQCSLPDHCRFPFVIADRPDPAADAAAALRLIRIASQWQADLIHLHGYRAAWVGALAAGGLTAPCVATAHNLFPNRAAPTARALLRTALARTRKVIAITQAVRVSLEFAGVPGGLIRVIPNGIDLEAVARAAGPVPAAGSRSWAMGELSDGGVTGAGPAGPVLLVAARLIPAKGVDVALRAMPAVRAVLPGALLMVAGDGPGAAALRQLAQALGVAAAVRFLGWRSDVPALMAGAHVCVIPSREEGQSLTALEAMALGVPVVASTVGGLPEMVKDGTTGRLVPPGDPPALAAALIETACNSDNARRRAQNARALVAERYSLDAMLQETASLYQHLLF